LHHALCLFNSILQGFPCKICKTIVNESINLEKGKKSYADGIAVGIAIKHRPMAKVPMPMALTCAAPTTLSTSTATVGLACPTPTAKLDRRPRRWAA
jgi:hypothetical protein